MRIAVFSDVHGNLTALDAVLDHIDGQEPLDGVVCAGDICLFGPHPVECLETIRQRGISYVAGNTDECIVDPPPIHGDLDEKTKKLRHNIWDWAGWTREKFSQSDHQFLGDVLSSFELRFSPTNDPDEDLLIVHANPKDLWQVIYPPLDIQGAILGEIRQSDEELEPLLGKVRASVLAFGHLHIPSIRFWRHLTLANISSVSLPGDGDSRAKYAVLSWKSDHGWIIEHFYVKYNTDSEISAYKTLKPPGWRERVDSLTTKGSYP